jgi:hypothetical protein
VRLSLFLSLKYAIKGETISYSSLLAHGAAHKTRARRQCTRGAIGRLLRARRAAYIQYPGTGRTAGGRARPSTLSSLAPRGLFSSGCMRLINLTYVNRRKKRRALCAHRTHAFSRLAMASYVLRCSLCCVYM